MPIIPYGPYEMDYADEVHGFSLLLGSGHLAEPTRPSGMCWHDCCMVSDRNDL